MELFEELFTRFVSVKYPCTNKFFLHFESRFEELWGNYKATKDRAQVYEVLKIVESLECMASTEKEHYFRIGYLMGKRATEELAQIPEHD